MTILEFPASPAQRPAPGVPLPLRITRLGVAVLGRLLPGLAARRAADIFYTAKRGRIGASESAFLDGGTELSLRFGELDLRGWRWGAASAPQILLQHGWEGFAGQFHVLAGALITQGFSVVAYDAPGHGRSPDGEANVTIIAEMLRAIERAHGPFVAAIGHSVGGAALGIAVQRGLGIERAVHIAAPASLQRALRRFGQFVALPPRALTRFLALLGAKVDRPLPELDFERAASPPSLPVLLLHDPADREVPAAESALVAGHWPGAQLRHVPGAGHRRILADARTLKLIGVFLDPLRASSPRSLVG